MRHHIVRIVGLTAAALALATTAGAQGKSKDKDHGNQGAKAKVAQDHRTSSGVVIRDRDDRDLYRDGRKVPPGLAKKPGQMPPGQYKKRYSTNEGADVLGGIFRRRGYSVVRVEPYGDSRYVYYRLSDGTTRRAIVSPGTERLTFTNVPASLLREVIAALY